jgi:CHAD domain-containing protein
MSKPKKKKRKKKANGLPPSVPVTRFAKDSLGRRLAVVIKAAPRAANRSGKDVEYVHQLRVGVRRAAAALELYKPLLSPKRRRKMKKQLRELRRAAGPARDLDVLAARLSEAAEAAPCERTSGLRDFVLAKRKRVQKIVKLGCGKTKRNGLAKDAKRLVRGVKWRGREPEPDFESFARSTLRPVVERFFAAGAADLTDVETLHRMRIEGKMVRYAMELLSPAFGKSFRKQTYPLFADVQDKLGAINDHVSAITFYGGLLESADPGNPDHANRGGKIEEMVEAEITALETSQREFLQWWTPERRESMRGQFEDAMGQRRPTDAPSVRRRAENPLNDAL